MKGAEALKKPPAKEPTVAEGFELQVEKRLQKRQLGRAGDEDKPQLFRSQPLPTKILEGVVVSLRPGLRDDPGDQGHFQFGPLALSSVSADGRVAKNLALNGKPAR